MLTLPKLHVLIPDFRSQDLMQAILSETGAVPPTKRRTVRSPPYCHFLHVSSLTVISTCNSLRALHRVALNKQTMDCRFTFSSALIALHVFLATCRQQA
jgi:hypothetical protein